MIPTLIFFSLLREAHRRRPGTGAVRGNGEWCDGIRTGERPLLAQSDLRGEGRARSWATGSTGRHGRRPHRRRAHVGRPAARRHNARRDRALTPHLYGTRPVDPAAPAAGRLGGGEAPSRTRDATSGSPARPRECLTGLATWKAAIVPDPARVGGRVQIRIWLGRGGRPLIGEFDRRSTCTGLARAQRGAGSRWGRVDKCIAAVRSSWARLANVRRRPLQSTGSTRRSALFLGYSPRSRRQPSPVHAPAEGFADVFLPPFKMALPAEPGGAEERHEQLHRDRHVPVADLVRAAHRPAARRA